MLVHRFNNSHPEEDFNKAVQENTSVQLPSGYRSKLRMFPPALDGVFPPGTLKSSVECTGVRQFQQLNLVLIGYDMRLENNVNWDTARNKFQRFLHRKLNLDKLSIEIEGIVSNTETWYIIKDSNGLVIKALRDMTDNETQSNSDSFVLKCVAVIGLIVLAGFAVAKGGT